jgi:hypothetical protein
MKLNSKAPGSDKIFRVERKYTAKRVSENPLCRKNGQSTPGNSQKNESDLITSLV